MRRKWPGALAHAAAKIREEYKLPESARRGRAPKGNRQNLPGESTAQKGAGLYHKGLFQLLLHRCVLERHVLRQPVLVRRIVFAADQRAQVFARLRRDMEAVLG